MEKMSTISAVFETRLKRVRDQFEASSNAVRGRVRFNSALVRFRPNRDRRNQLGRARKKSCEKIIAAQNFSFEFAFEFEFLIGNLNLKFEFEIRN